MSAKNETVETFNMSRASQMPLAVIKTPLDYFYCAKIARCNRCTVALRYIGNICAVFRSPDFTRATRPRKRRWWPTQQSSVALLTWYTSHVAWPRRRQCVIDDIILTSCFWRLDLN